MREQEEEEVKVEEEEDERRTRRWRLKRRSRISYAHLISGHNFPRNGFLEGCGNNKT